MASDPADQQKPFSIDWQERIERLFLSIGPGAIIASLTIGTGELIFSARAGVLFGYSILWVFTLLLLFKGVMVYTLARHLVLTGIHPLERWVNLPGPRGWLPMSLLVTASLLFPVWVGFHSGVIGTLVSQTTNLDSFTGGVLALGVTIALAASGGYARLERIQLVIVAAMVLGVLISLTLLRPDIVAMLEGMVVPRWFEYPAWMMDDRRYASLAQRPIWSELGTYVGVIGGSSFDYLAYAAYLRQKGWGNADGYTHKPIEVAKRDLSLVRTDLLVSFAAVMIISTAFVASGHLVLGPAHEIPNDDNMLNLQATFLTLLHPWLYPLYVAGAFLTMLGTLYGTIEVAPAVYHEWYRAYWGTQRPFFRRPCVAWVSTGGMIVLGGRVWSTMWTTKEASWSLVDIVTPAAIVTGVLMCGVICWANIWSELKFLNRQERLPTIGLLLNGLAGILFLAVGTRSLLEAKSVSSVPWLPIVLIFGLGTLAAIFIKPRRHRLEST